ncbi:MAG: ferrochelatase [Thermoguttaceae bacterium]|nr:ferrochelatase [Thermoguttaceae bacterium]
MFDAVLLASYGGPEGVREIEPFLDKILTGKRVPSDRRAAVVERYARFSGISPLPNECRRFLNELNDAFSTNPKRPRLYWGNLYSNPTFDDAFSQMESDAAKSVLVFPTSAFGSPQSCQRYRLAVQTAFNKRAESFVQSCRIAFTPPFFDLPAFRRSIADALLTELAWSELESERLFAPELSAGRNTRLILFSAHSLPVSDDEQAQYKRQLTNAVASTLEALLKSPAYGAKPADNVDASDSSLNGFPQKKTTLIPTSRQNEVVSEIQALLRKNSLDAALVFQSRSGSPSTPWLGPSPEEYLRKYVKKVPQLEQVVVSPIGFFFENMETIYDLDVEFKETCEELGIKYRRALCCGSSLQLVDAVCRLAELSPEDFPSCRCAKGSCDLSCRFKRE